MATLTEQGGRGGGNGGGRVEKMSHQQIHHGNAAIRRGSGACVRASLPSCVFPVCSGCTGSPPPSLYRSTHTVHFVHQCCAPLDLAADEGGVNVAAMYSMQKR